MTPNKKNPKGIFKKVSSKKIWNFPYVRFLGNSKTFLFLPLKNAW